jgi:hypothetical protein
VPQTAGLQQAQKKAPSFPSLQKAVTTREKEEARRLKLLAKFMLETTIFFGVKNKI